LHNSFLTIGIDSTSTLLQDGHLVNLDLLPISYAHQCIHSRKCIGIGSLSILISKALTNAIKGNLTFYGHDSTCIYEVLQNCEFSYIDIK
jgi:hypothetical protein